MKEIIAILFLSATTLMYAFGIIESKYTYKKYQEQTKQLQSKLDLCETKWRLDIDLFELEICKDICGIEQKE
jgi:hypothetical protein